MLIRGALPAEEGAKVRTAIERIADSYPFKDEEDVYRWPENRRADALVELAQTRIAEDPDPDRATILVSIDLDTLTRNSGIGQESSGGVFSSTVMQHVVCDARIQSLVRNGAGEAVGVGRTFRTVPPWLRRPMLKRDGGCRFPGCANRRFVDAHHVRWWTRGGETNLENLLSLCRGHHRLVHQKGWMVRGDPNGRVDFVDATGQPVRAGPGALEPAIGRWLWDDLLEQDYGTSEEHHNERRPPEHRRRRRRTS